MYTTMRDAGKYSKKTRFFPKAAVECEEQPEERLRTYFETWRE